MQTAPEIQEEIERYRADALYFEAHRAELLLQHPDCWVAIYNEQIQAAETNLGRLIEQLIMKGLRPGQVFREYLAEDDGLLILRER